jgi:pimeloyl-ACP methyl ester carboxylesterase
MGWTDPATRGPGGMYVEESGTPGSPAIVFIHGMGQSGRIWREHMARLTDFHCLAPDLPGFGQSNQLPSVSLGETADLVAELIETRVPARRASVVGISSGGWVIRDLLDHHPDRVERAVIDGAPVRPWGRRFRVLVFSAMSPFIHTRPVMASMREIWDAADLRAASRRAFRRSVTEGFLKPFAAIGVPNPTLFVAGERETSRTLTGCGVRESNAALATLMPHAEARFAPDLGHCWQRKAPDLHIRMVEAWCTGQTLPSELRPEPTPSSAAVERLRRMVPENWYLANKPKIMRQVRFTLRHFRKHLAAAYGQEEGEAIARETMQRFEALLPDLPDIGGDGNSHTKFLTLGAAGLATYRSLQARGASVEEAARLIYLGTASFFDSFPTRWLMRWRGRRLLGRKRRDQLRQAAAISQRRRYPDDWVFEVVEGDGRDFDFGVDYTECGIVKYLRREGAPELAPHLCWIDYPQYAAMHLRLDRTETLAQGGQRCDFRLSHGKPVQVEPEFLHV